MKTIFQHITSLFLALLVLASTQSYSINAHYCGNILVDKAIMKPAKKCSMHDEKTHSNHHHENKKDDCCDDEVDIIQGQDELKMPSVQTELPNPIFVEAFIICFLFDFPIEANKEKITLYEIPPPLLQKERLSLYQIYLI